LDNSVLGVEVIEQYATTKPNQSQPKVEQRQVLAGAETLWNIFNPKQGSRQQSYQATVQHELLLAPPEVQEGAKALGTIVIPLVVKIVDDSPSRDGHCISPELVGAGMLTSLYTSHRGAWHDPELGPGQFRVDHVANFVELQLSGFRFPNNDAPPADKKGIAPATYRIRARLGGISTETPHLHRNQAKWAYVLGEQLADPYVMKFNGLRLCLPLPPGCFGSFAANKRPRVEIEVVKGEHEIIQPLTYEDFKRSAGQQRVQHNKEEVIYRTSLSFDNVLTDNVKPVSAFFASGKAPTDDVVCDVFFNMVKKGKPTEAVLNLDFALRDRDYIKSTIGQPPGEQKTVCVGDNALMVIEEPLLYPVSKGEFRSRFVQTNGGKFDANRKDWPKPQRGAELRDPCLSSEYARSGLGELNPKVPFRQSVIPNYCTDIIPHKYVLPLSEQQFRADRRPGVWPLILDDLAEEKIAAKAGGPSRVIGARSVVTHLTHVKRQVPVVLLATYPDGTADVEIASNFLEDWARNKDRRYSLPGILLKHPSHDKASSPGAYRAILKKVQLRCVQSVHSAGFHVYDAKYKNITDYMAEPASVHGFNPREPVRPDVEEQFTVAAGPLPGDASPAACQYEWSLHVRSPTETDMYKFIAMLRQCVRVEHHSQSMKMETYQNKPLEQAAVPQQMGRGYVGGQLEVVLVEARRLGALGVHKGVHELKKTIASPFGLDHNYGPLHPEQLQQLKGTTQGEASKSTPLGAEISTFVSFRMKHGEEVMAYKSAKVQHSPIIRGTDSPCWASLAELVNSGGWTFKTGLIDPEKLHDLDIEFEVMQFSMGVSQTIGAIQLNVMQRPFLANPKEPFRNLWLPLLSAKDGKVTANETGEIHILTRWLPADKLYLPPGQRQVSVRSHFLKELWPKVCAQKIKEPLYSLEAQYFNYNPNLVRGANAESPPDFTRRHTEDLYSTVPYLECLERRQNKLWEEFDAKLQDDGLHNTRLGEVRLKWIHEEDTTRLDNLNRLIEGGIPSARRERMWLDLTMASRVLEKDGLNRRREGTDPEANRKAAEDDYIQVRDAGLPQRSDANNQLQEDAFHLAAWESTTPPVQELLDFHLRRLKRASDVCTALIAYDQSGVAYCESLFIVAFYLLLPQGFKEEDNDAVDGQPSMKSMSESSVFWLLYTLVGTRTNGTFKEYYGKPDPMPANADAQAPGGPAPGQDRLCVTSGAMHDVALLECCLAYHEHELWSFMTRIGLQLPTIFYGAFMRLYATYMPTATVFRFWDILFAQTSDPKAQPSGRVYLIDLAFGIIRSKRDDLMQCESAMECRQLILGVFGSLYDTTTAVEITLAAHRFLWGHVGFSFGKVGHLWTQREDLFKTVNDTINEQNEVLRILTHERSLGRIPQTKYESPPTAKGVTTKELLKDVLPVMQQAFETLRNRGTSAGSGRHWAMHRPMPLGAKALCENSLQKALNIAHAAFRGAAVQPIPCMVGPSDAADRGSKGCPGLEPLDITSGDMATVLQKDIPNWSNLGQHLWRTFTNRRDQYQQWKGNQNMDLQNIESQPAFMKFLFSNPQQVEWHKQQQANQGVQERISLNELFIALICCSRGTLGDKAAALFNIYSYVEPMPPGAAPLHWQPIARLAKSITKTADGTAEHMGKNLTPPDADSVKRDTVLHLQVYSNYPQKNTLVGDVYVPMLGPFVGYNPNEAEPLPYNIWGPLPASSQRFRVEGNSNEPQAITEDKVVVGELMMALTWTPKTIKQPEVGQLCLRLKSIRFYKMYVSDYFKMNPRVTVHTYTDPEDPAKPKEWPSQGHTSMKIPRWDPRGLVGTDQHHSWLTTSGAYGGNIDFDPTMMEGVIGRGEHFRHWIRHGADMGFNPDTEEWVWNETWGKQFSTENVQIAKKFMGLSQRKNVMGMHGVRHIVTGILQRSMLNVTNRQALLIADTLFNRQGAVPGILEAWLVGGTSPMPEAGVDPAKAVSLKKLKEQWAKETRLRAPVNVSDQIMVEHERQVQRFGFMNLFHESFMLDWQKKNGSRLSIDDMGIANSFKGQQKTLWIRYVRSGDGERCTQGVLINAGGTVADTPCPEIKLDMQECFPQNAVTKEEFISCMLNSPMLGESVRRIGATDHMPHPKKAIPLDVTIMDPHSEETDQQFMDAVNVGQSILLEVWDADVGSKDFLGECWLPPLSTIRAQKKDYVLPLIDCDPSEDGDRAPSPSADEKKIPKDQKITGELYVRLAWEYPVYKVADGAVVGAQSQAAESIKNRAQIQEQLHTGRLHLEVLKAQHLRRADASKGRDCDPQVIAVVYNETLKQWRSKELACTGVVRNNRNPKWRGEFKDSPFDIMTGSYEARFPPKQEGFFQEMKVMFRTPRQKRHVKEDRELNAVKRFGTAGLNVKFFETLPPEGSASSNDKGGDNHRVEVFLGDTTREFKAKLTEACRREADFWQRKANTAMEQRYRDVRMNFKHLVMVFVPSPKVQRLYAQKLHEGTEYKHAYNQAIQDPSSWQPLDPTRTFGQYPQYGFGRKQPQLLRIVEASPSYQLINLRYKEFAREMSRPSYQSRNEANECYGWAKYWHVNDGGVVPQPGAPAPTQSDFEWRPAFISKGATGADGAPLKYKIDWIFKPLTKGGGSKKTPEQPLALDERGRHEVTKQEILMQPRCPLVDAYVHPDHQELLDQTRQFRAIGKSDWEIEVILNKSLDDKWNADHPDGRQFTDGVTPRPPRITVDIIRNYLQRTDADAANKSGGAEMSQKAIAAGD